MLHKFTILHLNSPYPFCRFVFTRYLQLFHKMSVTIYNLCECTNFNHKLLIFDVYNYCFFHAIHSNSSPPLMFAPVGLLILNTLLTDRMMCIGLYRQARSDKTRNLTNSSFLYSSCLQLSIFGATYLNLRINLNYLDGLCFGDNANRKFAMFLLRNIRNNYTFR